MSSQEKFDKKIKKTPLKIRLMVSFDVHRIDNGGINKMKLLKELEEEVIGWVKDGMP